MAQHDIMGADTFVGPPVPDVSGPASWSLPSTSGWQAYVNPYVPPSSPLPPPQTVSVSYAPPSMASMNWAQELMRPSSVTARFMVTPPTAFPPSDYFDSNQRRQISEVSYAASSEIASAAGVRAEKAPFAFDYLIAGDGSLATPDQSSYYFDREAYLRGLYRNRLEDHYENAADYARQNRLPFAPWEEMTSPIRMIRETDEPMYTTTTTGEPVILAPVTQSDVTSFAEQRFPWRAGKNLPLVPPSVAQGPADLGSEVVKHEAGHTLGYASSEERGQYVDAISSAIGLDINPETGRYAGLSEINENKFVDSSGSDVPYPIENFVEFGPAAGALQRYYAQTHSGDRIDTPEKYDAWIKQFNGLNRNQIFDLPVSYEVKRALLYRLDPKYGPQIDKGYRFILPATLGNTSNYDYASNLV